MTEDERGAILAALPTAALRKAVVTAWFVHGLIDHDQTVFWFYAWSLKHA